MNFDHITDPVVAEKAAIKHEEKAQEVTVDATLSTVYQQRLAGWLDGLRDDCARRSVHYLMVETNTPFEKLILYDLRRLGLVR